MVENLQKSIKKAKNVAIAKLDNMPFSYKWAKDYTLLDLMELEKFIKECGFVSHSYDVDGYEVWTIEKGGDLYEVIFQGNS